MMSIIVFLIIVIAFLALLLGIGAIVNLDVFKEDKDETRSE